MELIGKRVESAIPEIGAMIGMFCFAPFPADYSFLCPHSVCPRLSFSAICFDLTGFMVIIPFLVTVISRAYATCAIFAAHFLGGPASLNFFQDLDDLMLGKTGFLHNLSWGWFYRNLRFYAALFYGRVTPHHAAPHPGHPVPHFILVASCFSLPRHHSHHSHCPAQPRVYCLLDLQPALTYSCPRCRKRHFLP